MARRLWALLLFPLYLLRALGRRLKAQAPPPFPPGDPHPNCLCATRRVSDEQMMARLAEHLGEVDAVEGVMLARCIAQRDGEHHLADALHAVLMLHITGMLEIHSAPLLEASADLRSATAELAARAAGGAN